MSTTAARLPLVTQEMAPLEAPGKKPHVSWQRAIVCIAFVAGAVVCAVTGQETIAASLAGAAAGYAMNREPNGHDKKGKE